MDSGNGSNQQQQQQRYCPTPIMAPPAVAASPPLMGSGNVMTPIHQSHHPPPSISPHPGAYYGHHSSGQSHYPTPSPTPPPPPPVHHQQYYAHSYYAQHGSHQQAQQQQSQQPPQHHGMTNAHVPMNSASPVPHTVQQGQHPHMMSHGSYHHPQTQSHHQQWATHPHQQQSHHYYHQPPQHHPPQQQVQSQQHGYPPPPHSPYPYAQPHPPAPTPPPHSPHPQQHIQQPPPQPQPQQHHLPPVAASPGPGQMHPTGQPNQSHALMNLSRFVSQQQTAPSPCPSPRASPSLAGHITQGGPQMGPQSPCPSPFSGHHDHHSNMNGHAVPVGPSSSPIISPPPMPVHSSQQAISPPPLPPPLVTQHQHHMQNSQQMPYGSINGGGMMERPCSRSSEPPPKPKDDSSDTRSRKHETLIKERGMHAMHSIFPNLSSGMCIKDNEDSTTTVADNSDTRSNSDDTPRHNKVDKSSCNVTSIPATISGGEVVASGPQKETMIMAADTGNKSSEFAEANGNGGATASKSQNLAGGRMSTSPQPKPIGSPSNAGNGHQMMPVRLQNMQKGARTKASMKKLMQEHQISTPNGQAAETGSDYMFNSAKDDSGELRSESSSKRETTGKGRPSKKKKSAVVTPLPAAEGNYDLMSTPVANQVVVRPGYTKSGKKIGRPRKDASKVDTAPPKGDKKGSKGKGKANKSTKKSQAMSLVADVVGVVEPDIPDMAVPENVPAAPGVSFKSAKLPKSSKGSRKRSSAVLNESGDGQNEVLETSTSLLERSLNESLKTDENEESTPVSVGGKRRKKAKSTVAQVESPNDDLLESVKPDSSISEKVAESVVLRLRVQPTQSPPKSKGRQKKSVAKVEPTFTSPPERRASPSRKKNLREPQSSPEREELPRLRSRSPKQRESPPLRISSPRAAKERNNSTGGAANPNQTSPSKSRSSREKEVASTIASPLSSPSQRSHKKSPEKETKRAVRKLQLNESLEPQDALLSPPPVKRTRQMSKESSESAEAPPKRGRKTSVPEPVAYESPPLADKRLSRRKSGSNSDNNMSSPSYNRSGSAPSDTSLEVQTDSVRPHFEDEIPSDNLTPYKDHPEAAAVPVPGKRKRGRRPSKTKSKSQKSVAKSSLVAPAVDHVPVMQISEYEQESGSQVQDLSSATPTPTKGKKPKTQRKRRTKMRRRSEAASVETVEAVPSAPDFDTVDPVALENSEAPLPSPGKQKGKKKGHKKSRRQSDAHPTASAMSTVLNIPTPAAGTSKKVPKLKVGKLAKQSKKSGKKGKKSKYAKDDSIEIVTGTVVEMEESFASPSTVTSPSDSPRRRRPSVVTPNDLPVKSAAPSTETSAWLRSEAVDGISSPGPKPLRRESRSISRDYEVSVVLTDIAQSLASPGELPSVGSPFDRQSPPKTTSPILSPPKVVSEVPPPAPELASVTKDKKPAMPKDLTLKIEPQAPAASTLEKTKKPKKSSLGNEAPAKPTKTKIMKLQRQLAMQERMAQLKAEVDQALLEKKGGDSSTSPSTSPAKSVSTTDSGEVTPQRKKGLKQRQRKGSTARKSIDAILSHREHELDTKEDLSQPIDESVVATPTVTSTPKPGRRKKRKMSKSKAKSVLVDNTGSTSVKSELGVSNSSLLQFSQSLPIVPQTAENKVKVAKTVLVPPPISSDPTVPSGVGGDPASSPVKTRKKRGRAKLSELVITVPTPTSSDVSPESEVKGAKKRRIRVKKEKGSETAGNVSSAPAEMPPAPKVEELSSSTAIPVKKRKPRKGKNAEVPVASGQEEPVPSTSSAAVALDNSGSMRLFPYQSVGKPVKRPTVLAKPSSKVEEKLSKEKEEDNQKKKARDAPSLKVLGGLTKFFRGGEEEDVDQDPRLPKDKAPMQTDNAVPWICSFCHLGPHAQKLGDLFGPYFANLPSIYGKPSTKRETWLHGDCALWAGRLLLIGTYLRRLEETLVNADKETCTVCGKTGATIGCLRRGCRQAVHYPCAIRKFWKMDDQQFHSYCPQHTIPC